MPAAKYGQASHVMGVAAEAESLKVNVHQTKVRVASGFSPVSLEIRLRLIFV